MQSKSNTVVPRLLFSGLTPAAVTCASFRNTIRCGVILVWLILGREGGSVFQSRGKDSKGGTDYKCTKVGDSEAAAAGRTKWIMV